MLALIFDTETTGLPKEKATFENLEEWPHIVQLSYILFNTATNSIVLSKNVYVKIPKNIEISEKAFQVHGISRDYLNLNGEHIKKVLYDFNRILKIANILIGHNISFDKKILTVEFLRNNIRHYFTSSKKYHCTMKENINFCNIIKYNKNNQEYKKFPTLMELFNILFPNETPKNLHDSFTDIIITLRCYYKKEFNADLFENNRRYKNLYIKQCTSKCHISAY